MNTRPGIPVEFMKLAERVKMLENIVAQLCWENKHILVGGVQLQFDRASKLLPDDYQVDEEVK